MPKLQGCLVNLHFFAAFCRSAIFALASLLMLTSGDVLAQGPTPNGEGAIPPSTQIPKGKAPAMELKLLKSTADEKVYAIIFYKGDEVLSGLTDFIIDHKVQDAHFTGIGAVSSATVGWLNLEKKGYHPIHVNQQAEVLSLIGDVATFEGVPQIHMHTVLGKSDGTTTGGHVWELNTNPTVEVFLTIKTTGLPKKADPGSGMKFIDPTF